MDEVLWPSVHALWPSLSMPCICAKHCAAFPPTAGVHVFFDGAVIVPSSTFPTVDLRMQARNRWPECKVNHPTRYPRPCICFVEANEELCCAVLQCLRAAQLTWGLTSCRHQACGYINMVEGAEDEIDEQGATAQCELRTAGVCHATPTQIWPRKMHLV